jgi:hypothetical protein
MGEGCCRIVALFRIVSLSCTTKHEEDQNQQDQGAD